MIEILCGSESGTFVLEVHGDLDAAAGQLLGSCLQAVVDSDATAVVLDLQQVGRIDECAADALVADTQRLADRGVSLSIRVEVGRSDGRASITTRAARVGGRPDTVLGGVAARRGGFNDSPPPRPQLSTDQSSR